MVGNTDFSSGVVDTITTPNDPYLSTYQAAINIGVPFVMVSLATYTRIDPHHLAAFSSRVMRIILRQQMHFRGVIISDDLGAAAAVAAVAPPTRAIDFLTAGGDMITSASLPPLRSWLPRCCGQLTRMQPSVPTSSRRTCVFSLLSSPAACCHVANQVVSTLRH